MSDSLFVAEGKSITFRKKTLEPGTEIKGLDPEQAKKHLEKGTLTKTAPKAKKEDKKAAPAAAKSSDK